ncbi:helix-turn-helix domain-containing protein [Pseudomonas sp. NCHU5208]|uniref:helix-turn-helix domain-containing protein n=1 Tax=unclassified Pseudomonas TaxID=196821 RepID=UPI003F98A074
MRTISHEQRKQLLEDILQRQLSGEQSLGTAIRRLRVEVTGLDQESFASMCGLSSRALYQIETDKGNPTLNTLDGILRKFGLRLGLSQAPAVPVVPSLGEKPAVYAKPRRGSNPKRKRGQAEPGKPA